MIDLNTLTLGEIDRIETLGGCSIDMISTDTQPKGKPLAALAFVVKRRNELAAGDKPRFTFNDAMALTMVEANTLIGLDQDDDEQAEADLDQLEATGGEAGDDGLHPTQEA